MDWLTQKCSYSHPYIDPVTGANKAVEVANIFGIRCIITRLLEIAFPLMVLAATAMAIFAGAKIVMGGDNPKEYQAGMQTLTYALVGLAGLGLSWLILRLIEAFTGAPVTILNF